MFNYTKNANTQKIIYLQPKNWDYLINYRVVEYCSPSSRERLKMLTGRVIFVSASNMSGLRTLLLYFGIENEEKLPRATKSRPITENKYQTEKSVLKFWL